MSKSELTSTGLFARWRNSGEVLKGSAAAFVIKFSGSILGFAMFALAARNMDATSFGSLALIFNTMAFFAVIATCGQETLIVRSWGEYLGQSQPHLAVAALNFGTRIVFTSSLIVALAVGMVWWLVDPGVQILLLVGGCSFLFAQSLMHFSAQFSRVAAGLLVGESLREVGWRLIVVLTILIHHQLGAQYTAVEFFLTAAGGLLFSVALQRILTSASIPKRTEAGSATVDIAEWTARSFRMWISALLETSSQYLEVVVVGLFLGPATAAYYFVATRITNVFAMIAGSITAYAVERISSLYHKNATAELQHILYSLSLISAALASIAFLTVLVLGKILLWAFGSIYVEAYPALIVLAIGASVTALTGPAAYLLLLTGNESAYPRIMTIGLLVRFSLIGILGSKFGLMGAAIGWSVSMAGLSFALVMACRRLVMIDPSIIHAFWRMPDRQDQLDRLRSV